MQQTRKDAVQGLRIGLVALLFLGTMLAYVDRQLLAILKPTIEAEFHWGDENFAHLASAFNLATAASVLFMGWLVDRFGPRLLYAVAMALWSLAGISQVFAATVSEFLVARVVLAIGESVTGPSTVKSCAQYLPLKARSVALGVVTMATNLGAVATPLLIPALALKLGWRDAFLLTGGLGLVWLVFWVVGTRRLTIVAETKSHQMRASISWREFLTDRRTWGIVGAKMFADTVWWFMLFWTPDLFHKVFHLDQASLGGPVALSYSMAALGALCAGLLFPWLLKRGASLNAARKGGMVLFAVLIVPLPFALYTGIPWIAALIIGLAMLAHNGFVTNIFGLMSDIVPLSHVGTIMALGSVGGNLSGAAMLEFAGWSLSHGKGYWPMFLWCSIAYLLATLWLHWRVPRIELASGHVEQGGARALPSVLH